MHGGAVKVRLSNEPSPALWFMFKSKVEPTVQVAVSDAKAQLTELIRRAEAGEEVILTRHGHPTVRLVPIKASLDKPARRAVLEAARAAGIEKAVAGLTAARSQDFLYDDEGLPS